MLSACVLSVYLCRRFAILSDYALSIFAVFLYVCLCCRNCLLCSLFMSYTYAWCVGFSNDGPPSLLVLVYSCSLCCKQYRHVYARCVLFLWVLLLSYLFSLSALSVACHLLKVPVFALVNDTIWLWYICWSVVTSPLFWCTGVECPTNTNGTDVPTGCGCSVGFWGSILPTDESPFYSGQCVGVFNLLLVWCVMVVHESSGLIFSFLIWSGALLFLCSYLLWSFPLSFAFASPASSCLLLSSVLSCVAFSLILSDALCVQRLRW